MNNNQLNTLIHSLVKIVGTALVTHGATKAANTLNSEDVIGAIVTVIGVILAHTAAGKSAPPSASSEAVVKVLPFIAILSLCGCANVYKGPQNQTLITERFFGVKVTSTSGSGTPEIVLGAGSSTFAVNPVSTNQLYAAPSFSTVQFSQSMNPFNTSGSESAGWGNVSVDLNTNSTAQSVTVVPKLNPPK
jgi:hypothetical protein